MHLPLATVLMFLSVACTRSWLFACNTFKFEQLSVGRSRSWTMWLLDDDDDDDDDDVLGFGAVYTRRELQTFRRNSLCLQPWRWKQYISPKRWHLHTSLNSARTDKNIVGVITLIAVTTVSLACSYVLAAWSIPGLWLDSQCAIAGEFLRVFNLLHKLLQWRPCLWSVSSMNPRTCSHSPRHQHRNTSGLQKESNSNLGEEVVSLLLLLLLLLQTQCWGPDIGSVGTDGPNQPTDGLTPLHISVCV
jgi:hypothetical protein